MANLNLLLRGALVYGIGLSLVLTVIMLISGVIAQDLFVDDYPPDIRWKYGEMSPRSARLRPFMGAIFFIPFLVIPLAGLFDLRSVLGDVSFISAMTFAGLAMLVFGTYDLLVIDWLFFCTIQPRAMVLPGTEGMVGYRDYRFHFIGFLKGLGFCVGGGLVVAGLMQIARFIGM